MKSKSSVMTFRLPDEILNFLRDEATEQKTSLNTLVNQIFAKHYEWDAFAQKYGFVNFPQDFYKGILDAADEATLVKSAAEAGRKLREYILFSFKRANPETFIAALRAAGRYSGLGTIELKQFGPKYYLILHHTLGSKHSLYVKTLLETAISNIVRCKPTSEMADTLVAIEFETPAAQEVLARPRVHNL